MLCGWAAQDRADLGWEEEKQEAGGFAALSKDAFTRDW